MSEQVPGFHDESKDHELPAEPGGKVRYIVSKTGAVYEPSEHGNRRVKDKRLAKQIYDDHVKAMAQRDERATAQKQALEQEIAVKAIAASIRSEPSRIITEE